MSQEHNVKRKENIERPIVYIVYQFAPTQLKYSLIEKEAFALLNAIKKFHSCVQDTKTIQRCDHLPLQSFLDGKIIY